jgi:ubiquitin carboxyl-terminal hydrolase 9/24
VTGFVGEEPLKGVPRGRLGFDPQRERKSHGIRYTGLRNQGCTCYLNATMQQLFMIPRFREGILTAPVPPPPAAEDPEVLAAKTGADLVGLRVRCTWASTKAYVAEVLEWREADGQHKIRYENDNETVWIDLAVGRPGHETGVFTVLPGPPSEKEAGVVLLREFQRTFRYMRFSEAAAFDPRPFVEACKCLRLEFSVYNQNDASEFFDKIVDRTEEALKLVTGKSLDYSACFGGKYIYQKIPVGCPHRSNREEDFTACPLQLRGHTSVRSSLEALCVGEMMDGDNKIECEMCAEKRDTVRRQCFSAAALPNVLPLHLKRFDLDYTTFETVKLNSRMEFPPELNMWEYTMEGLAEKELAEAAAKARAAGKEPEETAPAELPAGVCRENCAYTLKGVLIHSGVAQGGHYYSFVRDRDTG